MAVAAALGWTALILQLYLNVSIASADGTGSAVGLLRYFSFFTILTNILVALVFTFPLLAHSSRPAAFFARPDVVAAVTVYIVIVGLVYSLLLRALWNPTGLQLVADRLLHDVIPPALALYWLVFTPRGHTRWSHAAAWLLYPLVYFLYLLLLGAITRYYPYPFIDVGKLGYERVLLNSAGILVAFVAIGLIVVAADRALGRTRRGHQAIA